MNIMGTLYKIIVVVIVLLFGCNSCNRAIDPNKNLFQADLQEIKSRGRLVAITDYNSTGYFIRNGKPMGFQYELLQSLARQLDVKLELIIKTDMNEAFRMLNEGECDVIAYNLSVSKDKEDLVSFTEPHSVVKQVLVQRKPKNWRFMKVGSLEKTLVRSPMELVGKKVHVRYASNHYQKLVKLSEALGGEIEVVQENPDVESEELIRKVAREEIEYTIADEHVALANSYNYTNLDINTAISMPQKLAWAVRKSSPDLLKFTNDWMKELKTTKEFYATYDKYFKSTKSYSSNHSGHFSRQVGQISQYDSLIKLYAGKIGWDWRLLASVIRHESGFNPTAASVKGAVGLMQLLPSTAMQFGASDFNNPVESLHAGTNYLKYLDRFWSKRIPDKQERLKFVLGSYNAGQGHVLDAYNLASKYERDNGLWDENVAYFLLQKSDPQYYKDPIVKRGFCRGQEPVKYVNDIMNTYEQYKKNVKL
jgi:membrane-bound lytic murein transglycosylase F